MKNDTRSQIFWFKLLFISYNIYPIMGILVGGWGWVSWYKYGRQVFTPNSFCWTSLLPLWLSLQFSAFVNQNSDEQGPRSSSVTIIINNLQSTDNSSLNFSPARSEKKNRYVIIYYTHVICQRPRFYMNLLCHLVP